MRDLSLHMLDLIENAIRADATEVALDIELDREKDLLELAIQDNGRGLAMSPEDAADPFVTTKPGKRIGLGLSLFKEAAERAGGKMEVKPSNAGGLAVEAAMKLSHIDREPIGDVAETACGALCAAPRLNLKCRFACDRKNCEINSSALRTKMGANASHLEVAAVMAAEVKKAMRELGIDEDA